MFPSGTASTAQTPVLLVFGATDNAGAARSDLHGCRPRQPNL